MENFRRALEAYKNSPDTNHLFVMIQQAQWALNNTHCYSAIREVIQDVYGQAVDCSECEKITCYHLGLI